MKKVEAAGGAAQPERRWNPGVQEVEGALQRLTETLNQLSSKLTELPGGQNQTDRGGAEATGGSLSEKEKEDVEMFLVS